MSFLQPRLLESILETVAQSVRTRQSQAVGCVSSRVLGRFSGPSASDFWAPLSLGEMMEKVSENENLSSEICFGEDAFGCHAGKPKAKRPEHRGM